MLKPIARGINSVLFKFCLSMAALFGAFSFTFGTPGPLKDALSDSGVYNKVVGEIVSQTSKNQDDSDHNLPVGDPAVQEAANQAFSPSFLSDSTNKIIDGYYAWLDGSKQAVEFEIDAAKPKRDFAQAVSNIAYERVRKLPACTLSQLQSLRPGDQDLFNLPCQPPGLNFEAERDKLSDEIYQNDQFLKDEKVTADTFTSQQNPPVHERLPNAPKAYKLAGYLPWIFTLIALVTAGLLVVLHDNKQRAWQIISKALLVSGALIALGALLANFIVGRLGSGTELQKAVFEAVKILVRHFNTVLIVYGVVYAVVGLAIWLLCVRNQSDAKKG